MDRFNRRDSWSCCCRCCGWCIRVAPWMHRRGINILRRGLHHTAARAQLTEERCSFSNGDFKPRQRKFVPPAPPRLPDDSGAVNKKQSAFSEHHCEGLFLPGGTASKRAPLLVLASLVAWQHVTVYIGVLCFRVFFMAIHMFGPDCVSTPRLISCQTWLVYAEHAKSSTVKLYVCQTWRLVALDLRVADVCLDLVDANHCKSCTDCTKQLLGLLLLSLARPFHDVGGISSFIWNASKESESFLAYPPFISSHT